MSKFDGSKIRNVALLSHSGAGKTVITESALFEAKMVSRFGTIKDGNTFSDYEPEEHKRQNSVQTSIISCIWNDHKINFIDTPGFADYYGEVLSGVAAADIALLTVSAVSGIEVGTEQMWQLINKFNLATIIVVNKMDRENTNFVGLVEELRNKFGRECVPIQIPVGEGTNFSSVDNLLNENSDNTDERELLKEQLKPSSDINKNKCYARVVKKGNGWWYDFKRCNNNKINENYCEKHLINLKDGDVRYIGSKYFPFHYPKKINSNINVSDSDKLWVKKMEELFPNIYFDGEGILDLTKYDIYGNNI